MKILGRKSECRAVSADLWDFVGERLPEDALERVEKHLTFCVACQNEVEGMRRAQNLLRDCRTSVPTPRSDWHDLQNRMRAEGMISPLTGRILLHNTEEQSEPVRRSRRPILAINWERLSLAGSVAATLLLSISIYRLTTPQTQVLNSQRGMAPNFAAQENHHIASQPFGSNIPQDLGDPFRSLLTRVNFDDETAEERNMEQAPKAVAQTRQNEIRESDDEDESPIVWNKSARPHSPAPPQKYIARNVPSRSEQKPDENTFMPPALNMAKNAQDAKTRYIMQRLTPASYNEEGIY